jgi:hypothetical protein
MELAVRTDERTGQPTTWISLERLNPPVTFGVVFLYFVSALLIAGGLITLAVFEDGALPAEDAYDSGAGWVLQKIPLDYARAITAIAAGLAAGIWGFVARRIYHSETIGLATTWLIALDTGFLVQGHLVQSLPWEMLFAGSAVLIATLPYPRAHWAIPLPLALYGLENRASIFIGIAIFAILLTRGHIYATGKHVTTAFWQTIPALTGLFSTFHWSLLDAGARTLGPGSIHLHNPALWYTGIIAAIAGISGALLFIASQFRMARHPGRVQIRLQTRLPRILGRTLWNALLLPVLLPALIMHLLGGIRILTEDSRGFRFALYGGIFAFAIVYLVRFWSFILGNGTPEDMAALAEILPWIDFS